MSKIIASCEPAPHAEGSVDWIVSEIVVALDSQHKSQVTSHNMERGKVWFRMQKQ
jgi:hypothetical protein